MLRELPSAALNRVKAVDWLTVGFTTAIPLLIVYSFTAGVLFGVLAAHICVGPHWKWVGPVPVYRAYEKWSHE